MTDVTHMPWHQSDLNGAQEIEFALHAAIRRVAYLEAALEEHKRAAIRFGYDLPVSGVTDADADALAALRRYIAAGGSLEQLDGISRMLSTGRVHQRDIGALRAIWAASDVGHVGWGHGK